MSAREELQWGIRKRIGNGLSTRIWEDQWIPNQPLGKPTTAKPEECQIQKVVDLIEDYRWNRNLIFKNFKRGDAESILKIPTSMTGREDNTLWIGNQNGEYTMQSGYKSIQAKKEQEGRERGNGIESSSSQRRHHMWRVLWSLNISHKIKIFIWKGLKEAVPVKELIWRRMMKGDPICSGCGEDIETLKHMLLECNRAKEIWKVAPVQWDGIQELTWNFNTWNDKEFNNKTQEPGQVINKAWNAWIEFNDGIKKARSCNIGKTTTPHQTDEQEVRQNLEIRPGGMHIRISTKWNKETKSIGYGIVAADSRGQDVLGWKMRERESNNQLQHEAEGVKLALIKAAEQGWRLVCIEVPGKDLLQQIQGIKTVDMWLATLIDDIHELSIMFYKCSFCLGKSNRNDLSCLFRAQVLSNYHDIEWVNPNILC
ncbi:uncharacterized protein [Coffea arabica]|uniref:GATA-type domain-containing protein n=1 Tax=Coffea arabica TaxID=13443 RepID=A0A6P6SP45_COFAR|nr:uncharacterized protein LOC113693300 [Coffea arabica]